MKITANNKRNLVNEDDIVLGGKAKIIKNTYSDINIASFTNKSQLQIQEIPMDLIRPRKINEYILSAVSELSESIDNIGLLQPIIVKVNKEQSEEDPYQYVISAGGRRFAAKKMLLDKYSDNKDSPKYLRHKYISGIVLSPEQEADEEAIYRDTNDKARVTGAFEYVIRHDPKNIDMSNEETKKNYITLVYGVEKYREVSEGISSVKINNNSKVAYVYNLIKEGNPNIDISIDSVKKYVRLLEVAEPFLIEAILSGCVPLRVGLQICRYNKEEQKELLECYKDNNEEYNSTLDKIKNNDNAEQSNESTPVNNESRLIADVKKMIKLANDMCEYTGDFKKDKQNGNQKEYMKQINKIIVNIKTLNNMEKK